MAEFDFVSSPIENVFVHLGTSPQGLSDREAKKRRLIYGYNEPAKSKRISALGHLLLKFLNPLVVVLLIIAGFSWFFGEKLSTLIVTLMAFISVLLSFILEYRAGREAAHLSEMVHAKATVYRHGKARELLIREIVPGDIVDLFAGDIIPADLRIISCKDLFVNQASLTGESFPAEKAPGEIKIPTTSVTDLNNTCFMGSSVVSGTGLAVVIRTGMNTQFGEMALKLSETSVETSFDKGIRDFTWLMIKAMSIMVLFIFAINAVRRGNMIESLLFSLGVAVGLTPEMLPMLVTINLSKGAIAMSKKEVIVKRLNSIQNFGAMDVLCTDKTGTLTLNQIVLEKHCDVLGKEDEDTLLFAYINSSYQTGLKNLLDITILKHEKFAIRRFTKIDEIPFDFERKIMSVAVEMDGSHRLISKGAPEEIFKKCNRYYLDGKLHDMHHGLQANLKNEFDSLSREGFRVLAVAYRDEPTSKKVFSKEDERAMILKGYVAFLDPPKPTAKNAIQILEKLGIEIKVLTGDTELVTEKICKEVGLNVTGLINGEKLDTLDDAQLRDMVKTTTVFARLSPFQKERIIRTLHDIGHTVGYLGDGINDAPALKAADVGISVNNAVDIAKDSADIILLKKSLMVLQNGVLEGRKTFGNIIKYIKMGSSSNFGNMFSMTGGSLFLPFLPMLPIQILLNNFLYDLSQLAIPTDEVDKDYIIRPRPWKISSIRNFMVIIGPLSSIYDFITYAVMLFVFHASAELFHTGWFIESLCTQTLVIYIIRTGKIPFIQSMPSKWLIMSSILVVLTGILLPFTPLAAPFGFVVPPPGFFMILLLMISTYLLLVQAVKSWLIKRHGFD